jgi:hypothetical protein
MSHFIHDVERMERRQRISYQSASIRGIKMATKNSDERGKKIFKGLELVDRSIELSAERHRLLLELRRALLSQMVGKKS